MQLNKTKFNNKLNILSLFVRSFGFLQGASLRSSEVVRVVRRAMDDWLATPQGSKRTTKTSLLLGEPALSRNLLLRNKANFNTLKFTATSFSTVVYNDLKTKTKNGANPNKPNLKPIPNPPKTLTFIGEFRDFKSTLICKSKPNFPDPRNTASSCSGSPYSNLHPQTNKKSKPNPNPIQTQSKPNSNPIQTQFKPNFGGKANFEEPD